MKIAIQGGLGSYHQQAAKLLFGEDSEISYQIHFGDVFESLRNNQAQRGIIAIANNRYGFIPVPFDLLLNDGGETTQIVGEATLKIQHQLISHPGRSLRDIQEVHSQSPALGQCRRFLNQNLAQAQIVEHHDTAAAAEFVAKNPNLPIAAIASKQAAKLNHLKIIQKNIQDDQNNLTRFLVLSSPEVTQKQLHKADKTSIILETSNQPGSLFEALGLFNQQNINISSLHSSFVNNSDFKMRFFVEYHCGWNDPKNQILVQKLKQNGSQVTLLGSYLGNQKPLN